MDNQIQLVKRSPSVEVMTEDDLSKLFDTKKNPVSYVGLATTGPVHIGYLIPLTKLIHFSKAGIKNKILLADVHSALDDLKSGWDELDKKAEYYKKCIELAFPWEKKPEFVKGSSFQFSDKYIHDVLKLSTLTTVTRATRAASEVTRMKNPKVSELIYPIMQALDEEYLGADIQLGGIDQRHILAFAREILPAIGYKPRVEVMTRLIVSLKGPGVKMSASIPESSIKVYESEENIIKKINGAYCLTGVVKDNPILQITEDVIFTLNNKLKIERDKKFGGDREFSSYRELEEAFVNKELHPSDLKKAVAKSLVAIFKDARAYFDKHQDVLKELGPNFLP